VFSHVKAISWLPSAPAGDCSRNAAMTAARMGQGILIGASRIASAIHPGPGLRLDPTRGGTEAPLETHAYPVPRAGT